MAAGQGAGILHSSFATKYRYADSVYNSINAKNATVVISKLDSLEKWAASNGDNELATELNLFKIKKQWQAKSISVTDAERILFQQINDAHSHKLHYLEADALQALGEFYSSSQRFNHGFENFLAAYAIYSDYPIVDFPPKEQYLFSLGSSYFRYGDNENALKYLKEAIAVSDFILKNSYTKYNSIGLCYRNMAKYDSAEWYFRAIYDTAIAYNDTLWSGIAMGNIGITYYYEQKYAQAIPLLEKDIESSITHHVVRNAVGSMLILGSIYCQQNELDKAEHILLEALRLSEEKQFWFDFALAERLYTQLFKVYAAKKKPDLATMYADSAMVAKDSNNARNNALKFAKSQEKMDLIQRSLANRQLQSQRKINFFLALVSVLLLGIGLLAYLNQRMTARLNKQIISQKKEVEQLNDVKDRIFSVISHDMRTPVNSLIAFTELLERGNISEQKMAAYAAALKHNLGYTARLMENLLNWARTQMQGYKPVLETFDIAGTVEQAIELLQMDADKKGVLLRNDMAAGILVFADINMSLLLIRNLLNNALKYTSAGGTIIISSNSGQQVQQIVVEDTGIGIAATWVSEFNEKDKSQPMESRPGTNNEKGTGLGLMLCKKFVELMKGKITLESVEGKGSRFIVVLPVGKR